MSFQATWVFPLFLTELKTFFNSKQEVLVNTLAAFPVSRGCIQSREARCYLEGFNQYLRQGEQILLSWLQLFFFFKMSRMFWFLSAVLVSIDTIMWDFFRLTSWES